VQEWLETYYQLIVSVCKNIAINYEDLAHDVILKLNESEQRDIPEEELKFYIYIVARNLHRDNLKKDKTCELIYEPPHTENKQDADPYEYIRMIKQSDLTELEKLWIDTYLDCGGNYNQIERLIGVSRQTISKRIREAINKLK